MQSTGPRGPNQPFNEKPIAIMGASPGMLGSARAQYHLWQCFVFLNAVLINKPEVMIAAANTKFNEAGELTDDMAKKLIGDLL
jgi:chromate reductase, NAD(P)H dehydrogenase (quinone)